MIDRFPSLVIILTLLSACALGLAQQDVPAVIDHPTQESRAELWRAVRVTLGGAPVTIANDALTRGSLLIIEKAHPRDAKGVPLSGRDLDKPELFRLVRTGQQCVLVHERTGKRQTLIATSCLPK